MTAAALPRHLIARETAISIIINTVLSFAFFLLVFGRGDTLSVWGAGNLAFDNGVQVIMVALMSTLVPGALLRKRLGLTGKRSLIVRSLATGLIAAVFFAGLAAVILATVGLATLDWTVALAFKLLLGAGVAAIVTPIGLSAILRGAP